MTIWLWIVARLGSVGAWLASAAALVAALALAVLRIKAAGRAEERAAQAQETAKAVTAAKEVYDEVHSMGDDAVRRELDGWMRDRPGR